jgi:hypothetical protein
MKQKARTAIADCGHRVRLSKPIQVDCKECNVQCDIPFEATGRLAAAWLKLADEERHPGGCQCQPCRVSRKLIGWIQTGDSNG